MFGEKSGIFGEKFAIDTKLKFAALLGSTTDFKARCLTRALMLAALLGSMKDFKARRRISKLTSRVTTTPRLTTDFNARDLTWLATSLGSTTDFLAQCFAQLDDGLESSQSLKWTSKTKGYSEYTMDRASYNIESRI